MHLKINLMEWEGREEGDISKSITESLRNEVEVIN